jgi:hypothetical protein
MGGSPSRTRTCDHSINSRATQGLSKGQRWSADEQQIKAVAGPRNHLS